MLEIENLCFSRPVFALNLELCLDEAAYGILLGPSGSGKSTALRLIAGLLSPESGSIRLGGRELCALPPEKRKIGMVFQDYALFPHMSVRKNIEYSPRLSRMGKSARTKLASDLAVSLRIVDLLERKPSGLSGGEAQRVALARSLAARPDLLLLDEPLSSLDPSLRRDLRAELGAQVRKSGLMALHVTHDLEEALALGDRIYLMNRGRIVESGVPEELFERPKTAFAASFMGRGPLIPLTPLRPSRCPENLASTAFGSFLVSSAIEPIAKEASFLFFPASQAELLGHRDGQSSLPNNTFRGQVLDSIYRGLNREIHLEIKAQDSGSPPLIVRLELPSERRPTKGEILVFRVPPSACRIVSD